MVPAQRKRIGMAARIAAIACVVGRAVTSALLGSRPWHTTCPQSSIQGTAASAKTGAKTDQSAVHDQQVDENFS